MLDAIDAALIQALRADGRATYQAMAESVGLSRTAVRTRVRHMLASGAVRVVGVPAESLAGAQVLAHVEFTLHGSSEPLTRELRNRDSVVFAAHTTGRVPVVAYLRAGDDAQLRVELSALRQVSGVTRTDVFRTAKATHESLGAGDARATVDAVDWRLIRGLQEDGRASYAELARQLGLSQAAARSRVVRLLSVGMVHVTAFSASSSLGVNECVGFGANCRGDAGEVAAHLANVPGVTFVNSGFGRFDIVGIVVAPDRSGMVEALGAIRSLSDISDVESWTHLTVTKARHQSA